LVCSYSVVSACSQLEIRVHSRYNEGMKRFLLIAILCGVLLPSAPARAADNDDLRLVLALEKTVKEIAQRVEPSIACILVSRSDEYRKRYKDVSPTDKPWQLGDFKHKDSGLDLANSANVSESFGSGVVVSAERKLVLTNYHVIREATKIYVRLPGGNGSYANIHAADWRSDLAVLKLIDPVPLEEIKFGDGGKVQKGQIVLSLANPYSASFRDASPGVSWSIITNLRRSLPSPNENEEPPPFGRRGWRNPNPQEIADQQNKLLHHFGTLIQSDVKLSLGSSGGALLNLKGEMVGLISALAAIHGSEAPGSFAVPMNDAMKRIIDKLMQGREVEYGFLGVTPNQDGAGVSISQVTSGSPADRAGLHSGDDLVSIGGQRVNAKEDLYLFISTQLAGNTVRIDVRRGSEIHSVSAKLAKYHVPIEKSMFSDQPPLCRGLRVDYASLIPQRSRFGQSIPPGVVIREVQTNSPADRAKLQVDKIITEVKGQPVNTPAEFYAAMKKHSGPVEIRLFDPDKFLILEAQ
jgi:serine protease Do